MTQRLFFAVALTSPVWGQITYNIVASDMDDAIARGYQQYEQDFTRNGAVPLDVRVTSVGERGSILV